MPRKKIKEDCFVFGLEKETIDCKILRYWYAVPVDSICEKELTKIKNDLCVKSKFKDYVTDQDLPPIVMYHIVDGVLYVPPDYGLKLFGPPEKDLRRLGKEISIRFSDEFKLDSEKRQDEAFDKIVDKLQSMYGGAYLSLPPGDGKTITAIKCAAFCRRKIGVTLAKKALALQWKEQLTRFMPGVKVCIVSGKSKKIDPDADVIIVTIQTLLYNLDNVALTSALEDVGFFIIDEARHINANQFCRIMPLITCRRMMALDGTPNRKDGLDVVLRNWIGPVTFKTKKIYNCPVTVEILNIEYPKFKEKYVKTAKGKKYNRPVMMNTLLENPERNRFLLQKLIELSKSGKRCYIMSTRVKHITDFIDELQKIGADVGYLEKGLANHPEKYKEALSKKMVFATDIIGSDGLSFDDMDVLFFLVPITNPFQSSNRIIRGNTTSPKLILTTNDNWAFFQNTLKVQIDYFKKEGFDVQFQTREDAEQHSGRNYRVIEQGDKFVLRKTPAPAPKAPVLLKVCPFGGSKI